MEKERLKFVMIFRTKTGLRIHIQTRLLISRNRIRLFGEEEKIEYDPKKMEKICQLEFK